MAHVRPQPGGIVLVDDGEIVVIVLLGIDQEDAVRALKTYFRAVRAVGRVLPWRALGAAGYVEGQARGDREQPEHQGQPEGTWKALHEQLWIDPQSFEKTPGRI